MQDKNDHLVTFKFHELNHYLCKDEVYCKDEDLRETGAKPQRAGIAHLHETFLCLW